jgi:hypothetical protein
MLDGSAISDWSREVEFDLSLENTLQSKELKCWRLKDVFYKE